MSLVIFCLLFFFSVDYVPVKGEIIWYLSSAPVQLTRNPEYTFVSVISGYLAGPVDSNMVAV